MTHVYHIRARLFGCFCARVICARSAPLKRACGYPWAVDSIDGMKPVLVILVVGLSPRLIGKHTPNLQRLAGRGAMRPLRIPRAC